MQNRNRSQSPESAEDEPEVKVDLMRAIWWALGLFGVIVIGVVLAALLTDGLPDLPFDYEANDVDPEADFLAP
jgi:hypothetical protein